MNDEELLEVLLLLDSDKIYEAVKLLRVYDNTCYTLKISAYKLKQLALQHLNKTILT